MNSRSSAPTVVHRNLLKSLTETVHNSLKKCKAKAHSHRFTATYLLKWSNWVVCLVFRWPDGQLMLTYFCYRLKEPQAHGNANKQKQMLLSFISLLHPSLWCAESVHWSTDGEQIHITVLPFTSLCSSIITPRLTFHRVLTPRVASRVVNLTTVDTEETPDNSIRSDSPGKLALSTSIKNHLELPTIIYAFHRREQRAGRHPERVKYYRGRTHQDELRQHKASTQFRG